MTDPIRRDPTEFLRVLKKMATKTSWQKSMIFASKGRMVGYRLTVEHYNTVLFAQSVWGRALEIVRVIRAMNEDQVQMNGASYYYICNGMANADHGYNFDFPVSHRLPRLQHWRVAIEALDACVHNGFDATDTMYNSTLVACVVPGINRWREACRVLAEMRKDDRKLHPNAVKFLHNCLVRNFRPYEATMLVRLAAQQGIAGYESALTESNVFPVDALPATTPDLPKDDSVLPLPGYGVHPSDEQSVFRPRVYRQLRYKWHAVANKYRPTSTLKKRQLAPRDSPTGIPGFYRL